MRAVAILALVAMTMPSAAVAADQASQGQGFGLGMRSCAEFAKLYVETPDETEAAFYSWAQGFMSGLNLQDVFMKVGYKDLGAQSLDTQKGWLRSFCDQHPLKSYADAVVHLYSTFPTLPPAR